MDIKNFLDKVCGEIKYRPVRKGICEELKSHIQEIKEEYTNKGIPENEAEEKAVFQMGVPEEIGRKLNKIHKPKLDWKLLLLMVILMGFGVFVAILKQKNTNDNYIQSTIIYMIIGTILSIGIYFFDYKLLKKYSTVIYIIASILMILPMIQFGFIPRGVYNIQLFEITISPSTIALPLYLISFIGFIFNYNKTNNFKMTILNKEIEINKDMVKIIICSVASLMLMEYISSITNAIILGIIYLIISTAKIIQNKKNRIKNLIILYVIPVFMGLLLILMLVKSPYRFERIISSFNPEVDPESSGYVGMLQKEILENAKIIGEADTMPISNSQSIINVESNYTFIYLLGKTGILVAGLLVCTIILASVKLIINAKNIKEQYGKFLIIGLSSLYILQSFATILMNVNMGVQTNVNLPFVTYGGIYFIVSILSMAIIFSVYRRKDIYQYELENKIEANEN